MQHDEAKEVREIWGGKPCKHSALEKSTTWEHTLWIMSAQPMENASLNRKRIQLRQLETLIHLTPPTKNFKATKSSSQIS